MASPDDTEQPEEQLPALIDASPVALMEFGLDTRIRLWNPAAEPSCGRGSRTWPPRARGS